jgi:hypothetical protein
MQKLTMFTMTKDSGACADLQGNAVSRGLFAVAITGIDIVKCVAFMVWMLSM